MYSAEKLGIDLGMWLVLLVCIDKLIASKHMAI